MTVRPLDDPALAAAPDAPDVPEGLRVGPERAARDARAFAGAVTEAFDMAGASLRRADAAERSFASGSGGLQEMVLERAQADVALAIAGAAASRTAQALSTILGMQV